MKKIRWLMKNNSGATSIEYGLILAVITIVALVGINNLGDRMTQRFDKVEEAVLGQ